MTKLHSKGDIVADRFEVHEYMGSGGIGEVYRVTEGQKEYALKALLPGVVPGFADIEAVRSNAPLPLPGPSIIVFPRDFFESGDVRYILSDYIDGWNLRTVIDGRKKENNPLELLEAALFIYQLLERMSALPPTIVHGHLKPENLIYREPKSSDDVLSDRLWITDIGLHKNLAFSKYAWLQLSKGPAYSYLAPEYVSLGGRIDRRSDIYSIGVLAYELISGNLPGKEYQPLKETGWTGPDEIDVLLSRCLSRTPEERFFDFREFQKQWRKALPDLDRLIEEAPARLTSVDLFTGEAVASVEVDGSQFTEVDAFGEAPDAPREESKKKSGKKSERKPVPPPLQICVEEEVSEAAPNSEPVEEEEWVTEEEEIKKRDFQKPPHYRKHRQRKVGCMTLAAFAIVSAIAVAWFWF